MNTPTEDTITRIARRAHVMSEEQKLNHFCRVAQWAMSIAASQEWYSGLSYDEITAALSGLLRGEKRYKIDLRILSQQIRQWSRTKDFYVSNILDIALIYTEANPTVEWIEFKLRQFASTMTEYGNLDNDEFCGILDTMTRDS